MKQNQSQHQTSNPPIAPCRLPAMSKPIKFRLIRFLSTPHATYVAAIVVVLVIFRRIPHHGHAEYHPSPPVVNVLKYCDIFGGEWVPDADEGPRYTHRSCSMIQEHQNCLKYGRPDRGFLKWRWRPAGCELPRFEPAQFLELVRHKSLAFVGDSLARNHMQSLLCLLSQVEHPKDVSPTGSTEQNRVYRFADYNFTVSVFWSPFLVRANEPAQDGPGHTGLWSLYLDEPDGAWASAIAGFDYAVISASNWFTRRSLFYEGRRLVGCSACGREYGVPDLTFRHSQRAAFRTAFRAIGELEVKGKVIVRTLSPMAHFEGGTWDKGGDCPRTRPYRANETGLAGVDLDFYTAQVEEFGEAETAARAKGVDMVLMDITSAMLLRPDGHPSRYGHRPDEKAALYNDCIHWCLPGPIDVWNDMLFQMLLS